MRKTIQYLSAVVLGSAFLLSGNANAVEQKNAEEATTRNDAVIFKVHEIEPVLKDGVVIGCDFSVTLYNRTSINFRSFTIDMGWKDAVDDRFNFEQYMKAYVNPKEMEEHKKFLSQEPQSKPLSTKITVNAFGADKQITLRSHINSDKCFLMLSDAEYKVSPCDIVRSIDNEATKNVNSKECTQLFQFVNTSNPEYFGEFKNMSATELAAQEKSIEKGELADIDEIINKVVENLQSSDETLNSIN